MEATPSEPWSDEELLAQALAGGPDFAPGEGWAYSNTGYLLVRRIVDPAAPGGFAGALERELLDPLGLADTSLALELDDLEPARPGLEPQVGDGHRTSVAATTLAGSGTARSPRRADQRRFWTALAAGELCDLARLTESVEIGFDAPGFVRPSYGIGLMTDPAGPAACWSATAAADRLRSGGFAVVQGGSTRSSPSSSAATSGSTSRCRTLQLRTLSNS